MQNLRFIINSPQWQVGSFTKKLDGKSIFQTPGTRDKLWLNLEFNFGSSEQILALLLQLSAVNIISLDADLSFFTSAFCFRISHFASLKNIWNSFKCFIQTLHHVTKQDENFDPAVKIFTENFKTSCQNDWDPKYGQTLRPCLPFQLWPSVLLKGNASGSDGGWDFNLLRLSLLHYTQKV